MSNAWSAADRLAMHEALNEARRAAECDEVPIGAVVMHHGEIVARGRNRTIADRDPSAHAEVVALRAASIAAENHRLADATLYVSLEPCVMCVGALAQARVNRVVFAAYDRKAGALGSVEDLSESSALNHHFEINGGLFAAEATELLQNFFSRRR